MRQFSLNLGGGGGSSNSFTIIQTDFGTSPTATSSTSTLTFTSSDGSITITGTASSKTVNFQAASGTVTSVGLADSTGIFNVTGSPVNTSGTLTLASFKSQSQNLFLASPNGSSGALALRAIVAADVPTLNQNTTGTAANITATSNSTLTTLSGLTTASSLVTVGTITTGTWTGTTIAIANGGTGQTTANAAINALLPSQTGVTSGWVLQTNGTNTSWVAQSGGGSGVTTLAAVGSSPNANAGTISGVTLNLQPCDGSNPGVISTAAQTLGSGVKKFSSNQLLLGSSNNIGITDVAIWASISSGTQNTGLGSGVLSGLTSGGANVAVGYQVNFGKTVTGSNNTCVGNQAAYYLTSGIQNVAIGDAAMSGNSGGITGSNNAGVGESALVKISSGSNNSCLGNTAGGSITSGSQNVSIGASAHPSLATGTSSIAIGTSSGGTVTGGKYNICLGFGSAHSGSGVTNECVIGGTGQDVSGSGGGGVSVVYIGNTATNSSPMSFTLNATGGSGSNIAGASMTFASGIGTGTGAGGTIVFKTAAAGTTGSSPNTLATASSIDQYGNFIHNASLVLGYQRVASATSAGSTTINNNISFLVLHASGTLTTYTVTMPATPIDGQLVNVTCNQSITTLTLSGNSGQTIVGAPVTLATGAGINYIWVNADSLWYPF
jgi:hypothetical protein